MRSLILVFFVLFPDISFASNLPLSTNTNKLRLIILDFQADPESGSIEDLIDGILTPLEEELAKSKSITLVQRVEYQDILSRIVYQFDTERDRIFKSRERDELEKIKADAVLVGSISGEKGKILIRVKLISLQSDHALLHGKVTLGIGAMRSSKQFERVMRLLGQEISYQLTPPVSEAFRKSSFWSLILSVAGAMLAGVLIGYWKRLGRHILPWGRRGILLVALFYLVFAAIGIFCNYSLHCTSPPLWSVVSAKDLGAVISLKSMSGNLSEEFCRDIDVDSELLEIADDAELSDIWLGGIGIPLQNPGSPGLYLLNTGKREYSAGELEAIRQRIANIFLIFSLKPFADISVDLHPKKNFGGVHEDLVGTELGRDLLFQDLELKKTIANILKPSTDYAMQFWKIYEEEKHFFEEATPNIRVWIEPGELVITEGQEDGMVKYTLEKMRFSLFADLEGLKREHEAGSRLLTYFKEVILPKIEQEIYFSDRFKLLRQLLSIAIFAKRYEEIIGGPLREFYEKNPVPVHTFEQFEADLAKIWEEYLRLYRSGIWECSRDFYDYERRSYVNRVIVSGRVDFSNIGEVMRVERFSQR